MEGLRKDAWQDSYDDQYDEVTCPQCNHLIVHEKNITGHTVIVKCSKCGQEIPVETDPDLTPKS